MDFILLKTPSSNLLLSPSDSSIISEVFLFQSPLPNFQACFMYIVVTLCCCFFFSFLLPISHNQYLELLNHLKKQKSVVLKISVFHERRSLNSLPLFFIFILSFTLQNAVKNVATPLIMLLQQLLPSSHVSISYFYCISYIQFKKKLICSNTWLISVS